MNRADKIGYGVSAALHAGVILWAIVGGALFKPKPNEPTVISQVAVMSQQDFNAMMASAPKDAPQPTPDPQAPIAPKTPDAATPPDTPAPDVQAKPEPTPKPVPAPKPDAQPDVSALTEPPAPTDVAQTPPVMAPPVEVPSDTLSPKISPQPKPKDVPRVAPTPTPPPPPEAKVAETAKPQETPDPTAKPVPVPPKPKQSEAPPEATTEIVTEATKTDTAPETSAPLSSPRPASKPKPPAPTQTAAADTPAKPDTPSKPETAKPTPAKPATPEAPPKKADTSAAVTDALAAALGGEGTGGTGQAPVGPPITAGEKDALIVDVKQCWNVGALSSDALRTTVTLSVEMRPDGHPIIGSIKLVDSAGGTGAAVDQAFEAGKRAIVRCGSDGFPLPSDKYAQWKTIEIDFNPEKMRMK
jgi:hypothetical protein